jgi:two-component system, sensor histidine kinase PdtaS
MLTNQKDMFNFKSYKYFNSKPMRITFLLILSLFASVLLSQNAVDMKKHQSSNTEDVKFQIVELDKQIEAYRKQSDGKSSLTDLLHLLQQKADLHMKIRDFDAIEKTYIETISLAEKGGMDSLGYIQCKALTQFYTIRPNGKPIHPWYLKKAAFATKMNQSVALVRSYTDLANSYLFLGKTDSALFCFKKAQNALDENDKNAAKYYYFFLSKFYKKNGDNQGALMYLTKVLDYDREVSEGPMRTVDYLNEMGFLHTTLKNYDRAQTYLLRAMDTCQKHNLQITQVSTAINLSNVFMAKKDTTKAIGIVKEAFNKNYSSTNPNSKEKALAQLSDIYLKQNKPKEAFFYLTEWNNHLLKYNDPSVFNDLKINWGTYFFLNNQNTEAIKVLDEALLFAKSRNSVSQILKIYDLKSKVYTRNKQSDLALENVQNYHALNDSINQKSKVETLIAIESRFQLNEKDKTIGDLSSDNQLKAQLLESSKKLQYLAISAALFLAGLAGFAFYQYRMKQKQAHILSENNTLLTKTYKEKDLLLREIHHRVKNNLQVISSLLRLQSKYVKDDTAQVALQEGQSRVQSMALIHNYLYNEDNLKNIDAKEYIEKLIETLFQTYNIAENRITAHTKIDTIRLDVDEAVPIGLILNELITNSLKYAFPNERKGDLDILLQKKEDILTLKVNDNGVGFEKDIQSIIVDAKSFGWNLINLFADKLDAKLTVENKNGTHVTMVFKV